MTISQLAERISLRVVQERFEDRQVGGAYTSDLLSDVMANAAEADLLITIQSHANTVAVASLVGAAAILICNDRPVPEDMIAAAAREEIAILLSSENQFTLSGRIYALLNGLPPTA